MNKIVCALVMSADGSGRIKCGMLQRDFLKCSIVEIGECCIQTACCELGRMAINVYDQIEFHIDTYGMGLGVANVLEHRGYKVVDLRKVGMVPNGYSNVNTKTGDVTVESVLETKAELLAGQVTVTAEYANSRLKVNADTGIVSNVPNPPITKMIQMVDRYYTSVSSITPPPVELEATDEPITVG